jgi:hypothetical protein
MSAVAEVARGTQAPHSVTTADHILALSEWLYFRPDAPKDEIDRHIDELQVLASANDEWTRILATTGILLLGDGTPELCQQRNDLIDLGIRDPGAFRFPDDLRDGASPKELQRDLPNTFRAIFHHQLGDPLLKPEWFDPSHPASRFFRSRPREFYELIGASWEGEAKEHEG